MPVPVQYGLQIRRTAPSQRGIVAVIAKPPGMPAAVDMAVTLMVSALITAFAKLYYVAIDMSA
jgi:hypothetical protein